MYLAFKDRNEAKRRVSAYHFLERYDLTAHVWTRVSKIVDSVMQTGRRDYCQRVMTMYNMLIGNPKLLCNTARTPVYI